MPSIHPIYGIVPPRHVLQVLTPRFQPRVSPTGTWQDASRYANDAVLTGSAGAITPNGYDLSASGQEAAVAALVNSELDLAQSSSGFSLTVWCAPSSNTVASGYHHLHVRQGEWVITVNSGQLQVYNGAWRSTGYYPTAGVSIMVTVRFAGGYTSVFVNGSLVWSGASTNPTGGVSNDIVLGWDTTPWLGVLHETVICSPALSDDAIHELWSQTSNW